MRIPVIILIFIAAALLYFSPGLIANETTYVGPNWEYAEMFYFPDMKTAFPASTNPAENEVLIELFTELGMEMSSDEIGTILYLRIMGDRGWELVSRLQDDGIVGFTFKRAK